MNCYIVGFFFVDSRLTKRSGLVNIFWSHVNDDNCDLQECCICLSSYDDGVELRQLPCGHHFHCSCIDKWLFINATCPLCKYNILKSSNNDQGEVQSCS